MDTENQKHIESDGPVQEELQKTGKFYSMIKRLGFNKLRWYVFFGVIGIIIIMSIVYMVLAISWGREIRDRSDSLKKELYQLFSKTYGDYDKEINSYEFISAFPFIDEDKMWENIRDEEAGYSSLSLAEQKKKIEEANLFALCNNLSDVYDHSVFMSERWHAIFNDEFDFANWEKYRGLSLISTRNVAYSVSYCADWYIKDGQKAKGVELIHKGLKFISLLPDDSLINLMIKNAIRSIILVPVQNNIQIFTIKQLNELNVKIPKICLNFPGSYYIFWLIDPFWISAIYLENGLDADYWYPYGGTRGAGWVFLNLMMKNNWYVVEYLRRCRKIFELRKSYILKGDYIGGVNEIYDLTINARKTWYFSFLSAFRLPSNIKSSIALLETDANTFLMLLMIRARIFHMENGVYPISFNDIVKKGEYHGLTIGPDGHSLKFRGYKIEFIPYMPDKTTEYKDPEIRKKHTAFCAYSIDYGNSGESTYIINEKGKIYMLDFGSGTLINEMPEDPVKDGWIRSE